MGTMRSFAGLLILSTLSFSQDITATIRGTVFDSTGRVIPRAFVSAFDTERNLTVRTITTDAEGNYAVPQIPIGTYRVKVEAKGFKTTEQSGIVLNVADIRRLDFTLQVGNTTETVEVKADVVQVELGSPANATVVTGVEVRELSLGSRNYEQLVALSPGVSPSTTDELYIGVSSPSGLAATLPYSINGSRNSGNNWTLDGADNVDRGSNLTLLNYPSIDAIEQFKVERSLYTADSGRAGGGQINVVTKSGTSRYHGSAFEFARNDAFAANSWSNNANKVNLVNGAAKVPPLRWNDFGFTFGGPVKLPGLKSDNKTFFFYSQEWRKIITYTTFQPTLPTTSMIQGSFPTPVCISYTTSCQQTATQVPASLINPIAKQYVADIYSKIGLGATSTTSGFFPQRNIYDSRQELVRLDHSFNQRWSVWFRFIDDSIPTVEPGGLFTGSTLPNVATTSTNAPGRSYVAHVGAVLSTRLYNDAGFAFSRGAILSTPQGLTSKANSPDIQVPQPYSNPEGVVPTVSITGGTSIIGYGPYTEYNRNYNFFDNLSLARGRHTFKFGASLNRYQKTENAASGQGIYSFSNTGAPAGTTSFSQGFANFLLGNVSSYTQPSQDITPNLHAWQSELYAQDDFKVAPRVTLYLGIRWSYFGQPTEDNGILDNFLPSAYNPANAPQINTTNGNVITGTGKSPFTNGIIIGGQNSPFGSAVAPTRKTNFGPRLGITFDPTGSGKTAIRAGYGIYYDSSLFGVYEQNIFQNPPVVQSVTLSNFPWSNFAAGTPPGTTSTAFIHGTPVENLTPYTQQYSFSIQRNLGRGMILDTGYFGSKGTHLIGIVDINQAYPGVALAAGLHSGTGTIFTTADDPRINAVRPYLGFNAINVIMPAFDSSYHSWQTSFAKQFRPGGVVRSAFTWSKNLTDNASDRSSAPQNTYNYHNGEYGPATLDRKFIFNVNYVYPLPFFTKGAHAKGLTGAALGGWQLTGIYTAYSGSPFTVSTSGVDPAGLGLLGNSASASRPDMVCDPNQGAPHTLAQWFKTSCFQPVPQGAVRPGNAGRGVVRGPGFWNWDASLMKTFRLGEQYKLQFRAESFNTLNHASPSGFASTNITSTLFGQVTGFRAPRRIQLALKLTF